MAVTIMSSKYALLNKLKIDSAPLEAAGVKMQLGFYDVKLINESNGTAWQYKLPVSTNDIMKGMVPDAQMDVVAGAIVKGIKEILKVEGATVNLAEKYDVDLTPPKKEVKPQDAPKAPVANDALLPQIVVNMERVKLIDATRLYQPVFGSSSDSKYFVVALNKDVKIAARVLGDNVSIRAEGKMTTALVAALSAAGVDKKDDSYASGHFKLQNKVPANRLIGAVLMGTGLEFDTPVPVVKYFEKLGH